MNRAIRDVYLEWMQLMNRGAFEEALATAQELLELADQEEDKGWRENLEGCLKTTTASLERLQQLKREFAAAHGAETNSADWCAEYGGCLMEGGALLEAAEAFTRAVSLAPQHVYAWDCLGVVSSELMDEFYSLEQVLQFFDQALALAPLSAEIWYHKGLALTQAAHAKEALECYEHILNTIDAKHPGALAMREFERSK